MENRNPAPHSQKPTHLAHWRLREPPFTRGLDPRGYAPSSSHEEALARLNYVVEAQLRLGLLLGTPGSGKSFILAVLARQLRTTPGQVLRLGLQGFSPQEFLWSIGTRLGLLIEPQTTQFELWQALADRLAENRLQRLPTVFLLDDIDLAPRETLEHALRLARIEPSCPNYVTIVGAGNLRGVERLSRQLREIAELRIDLGPWELSDTEYFIQTSLARAGQNPEFPIFSPEALFRLHELSAGTVRRVVRLAELALIAGAGGKLRQIDAHTIEAVYEELGVMDDLASIDRLS